MLDVKVEDNYQLLQLRKDAINFAFRIPQNVSQVNGQYLPQTVNAESILKEADKIMDWLLKDAK